MAAMRASETTEDHATLALRALGGTRAEPRRALRLLDTTGLTPADLRSRVNDPVVLVAALGFLQAHQPDLIECADGIGVTPERLIAAHEALAGA